MTTLANPIVPKFGVVGRLIKKQIGEMTILIHKDLNSFSLADHWH
jgi:hypothetical protein